MFRILIADDHAIMRQGLKDLLLEEYPTAVIDEVADADTLLTHTLTNPPDLVISDLMMPGRSVIDAIHEIRKLLPQTPVLVLSMNADEHHAIRLLKAGASGYINKGAASEELVLAVQRVLQGRKYVSPKVAEMLAEGHGSDNRPGHEQLSEREFEVLRLLSNGLHVSEIAEQLSLGITTVSTYRARILQKMRLRSNADLTRYVVENKLFSV